MCAWAGCRRTLGPAGDRSPTRAASENVKHRSFGIACFYYTAANDGKVREAGVRTPGCKFRRDQRFTPFRERVSFNVPAF